MDSLIPIIEFNEDYHYTDYIPGSHQACPEIDSLSSATKNTADFIYYQNVILEIPRKGLRFIKHSRERNSHPKPLRGESILHLWLR